MRTNVRCTGTHPEVKQMPEMSVNLWSELSCSLRNAHQWGPHSCTVLSEVVATPEQDVMELVKTEYRVMVKSTG